MTGERENLSYTSATLAISSGWLRLTRCSCTSLKKTGNTKPGQKLQHNVASVAKEAADFLWPDPESNSKVLPRCTTTQTAVVAAESLYHPHSTSHDRQTGSTFRSLMRGEKRSVSLEYHRSKQCLILDCETFTNNKWLQMGYRSSVVIRKDAKARKADCHLASSYVTHCHVLLPIHVPNLEAHRKTIVAGITPKVVSNKGIKRPRERRWCRATQYGSGSGNLL